MKKIDFYTAERWTMTFFFVVFYFVVLVVSWFISPGLFFVLFAIAVIPTFLIFGPIVLQWFWNKYIAK